MNNPWTALLAIIVVITMLYAMTEIQEMIKEESKKTQTTEEKSFNTHFGANPTFGIAR